MVMVMAMVMVMVTIIVMVLTLSQKVYTPSLPHCNKSVIPV
jgi:hypothetical protein